MENILFTERTIKLSFIPEENITMEMCFAAVQNNGITLYHVPKRFKTMEMCFAAVQNNGIALYHVPKRFKTMEMCFAAVQNNGTALYYVPKRLKTMEMCFVAVQNNGYALKYVPDELRTIGTCLAAVQTYCYSLVHVPIELRTREVCLAAVQKCGDMLEYVPDELKTPEICFAAVNNDNYALRYVPKRYQTKKIIAEIIETVEQKKFSLSDIRYEARILLTTIMTAENQSDIQGTEAPDTLSLELGYGLIPLVDKGNGAKLLERIQSLRRQIAQETGLEFSKIRIVDNMLLGKSEYCFRVRGVKAGKGNLKMWHYLCYWDSSIKEELPGKKTKDPVIGVPALWLEEDRWDEAKNAGYTVADHPGIITFHLTKIIYDHAEELFGCQESQLMVHKLSTAILDKILMGRFRFFKFTETFQ